MEQVNNLNETTKRLLAKESELREVTSCLLGKKL